MSDLLSPQLAAVIPAAIHTEIMQRLKRVERHENVRILLAVESGSRAWGFHSPNSDFDVRFIYMRDPSWYLAVDLEEKRDVIEYEIVDDIDLNGWDVRKALRLFGKSNPAFVEWIQSALIYHEHGAFAEGARAALECVYSVQRGIYHYRSMAKTNYRGYLRGDLVPLKKYFYVLRPLLSVRWLERYGCAAPIEFASLLHLIDDQPQLQRDIDHLLEQKRVAPEMGLAPAVASINQFIVAELERLDMIAPPKDRPGPALPLLNDLFTAALAEYASAAG